MHTARAGLLGLPKEILSIICSHLDQQSAIKLLYVHRDLHSHADKRVCQEINLSPSRHFGETPGVQLEGWEDQRDWELEQHLRKKVARQYRVRDIAERAIQSFCLRPHRWTWVKTISMYPSISSQVAMTQLLSFARVHVQSLTIDMRDVGPLASSDLDLELRRAFWRTLPQLAWPLEDDRVLQNLTCLSIHLTENCCTTKLVPFLCLTPHLVTLTITQEHEWAEMPAGSFPTVDEDFIEDLHFLQRLRHFTFMGPATNDGLDPPLIADILRLAPLRSLEYGNKLGERDSNAWSTSIVLANDGIDLQHLAVLCDNYGWPFNFHERFRATRFDNLTTLCLSDENVMVFPELTQIEFLKLPRGVKLPQLRIIVIRPTPEDEPHQFWQRPRDEPVIPMSESPQALPLTRATVQALDQLPNLTFVFFGDTHVDDLCKIPSSWEAADCNGIWIRSIRHGDRSLLCVRSHTDSEPCGAIHDEMEPQSPCGCDETNGIKYDIPDGTTHILHFVPSDGPRWQDATDFEGLVVPVSVIDDIQRVEGDGVDWSSRNIEVSEEGWQVLLDWKAACHRHM